MSIIYEFHRNSQEKVIIQLQEYKGKEYVDLRIYYDQSLGQDSEWLPTQKGIKLRPDLLAELINGLNKALAQIEFNNPSESPEKPQRSISGQEYRD